MPKVHPSCRSVVACSPLNGRGWKELSYNDNSECGQLGVGAHRAEGHITKHKGRGGALHQQELDLLLSPLPPLASLQLG